ncbi:MAG: lysostaphin resistance A-like protein [Microbacteriaceae bacterium]
MTQPPPPTGPPLPHSGIRPGEQAHQPWTPPPGWIPTPQGWIPPQPVHVPRRFRPPLTAGPLPFHRLFRGLAGFAWWRPLVAIGVGFAAYLVISVLFTLVLVGIGVAAGEIDLGVTAQDANDALVELTQIDAASPLSLLLALGSVALLLPSAIIGQLAAGLRPLGVRHSVAFRVRWRWFFVSLIPAFATVGAAFLIPVAVSLAFGEVPFGPMTTDPALFALCAAIILVITPLQSAAEEYVFRGLLAQSIGSWLRFAPVGWIITTIVFVSGHVYDVWGLLSVGAFGFGAAVIVSRTGGLEAGIALHSVNNIASFLVLASGVQGTTVNPTSGSTDLGVNLVSIAIALLTTAAWVLWVDRWAKRRALATLGGMLPPTAHNSVAPEPAAGAAS